MSSPGGAERRRGCKPRPYAWKAYKLFGLFTVEVSGKEVYLTVGGKLGADNRAVEFIPTDIKVDSLPVPLTMVESTRRDRLNTLP